VTAKDKKMKTVEPKDFFKFEISKNIIKDTVSRNELYEHLSLWAASEGVWLDVNDAISYLLDTTDENDYPDWAQFDADEKWIQNYFDNKPCTD
jgi:hypothetical protein